MNASQSNQEKIFARLEVFNREITQKINDESIDIDKLDVIEKTSEWVADQLCLLDILCNLILENLSLFTNGKEKDNVNEIVRERIIGDWENGSAARHLKEIQQSILDDERNQELLKLYVKILKIQERGGITIDDNQDRRKLLDVGIIREGKDGRLKVANPIYESVFNREWARAYQNLPTLPQITSNQKVNNKGRASKQSKLFSQIILFSFLIIAVVYTNSQLRKDLQQQSARSSKQVSNESQQPSQSTPSPKDECFISKDKTKSFSWNALAEDAESALATEFEAIKRDDLSDLKGFNRSQFKILQSDCDFVVKTKLNPNQTLYEKHEKRLREVITQGVNPQAISQMKIKFDPPSEPNPKSN